MCWSDACENEGSSLALAHSLRSRPYALASLALACSLRSHRPPLARALFALSPGLAPFSKMDNF